MKHLKLFEYFDKINNLVSNTKDILSSLRDFGFDVKVNSERDGITIRLSKKRSEELRVFQSSDVSNLLEESDKYLSLGEGLKLESIFLETIEGSKELQSVDSLKRERVGIISIYISYYKISL